MEVIIKLNSKDHAASIQITEDDLSVTEKKIKPADLRKAFSEERPECYFRPIDLFHQYPNINTYPGLLVGNTSGKITTGVFFLPAGIRYMNFAGTKSMLPFPSLLFIIHAKGGAIFDSKCFALTEKTENDLSPGSLIYAFPYGNVSPTTGNICWGSTSLPTNVGYREMWNAIELFMSAESNIDLSVAGQSYKGFETMEFLIKDVAEKEEFPQEYLVKCMNKYTLNDILKCVLPTQE